MVDCEKKYMVSPDYLSRSQTDIKDTSRAFLIEWMMDVHRKFRLQSETLYVSINIVDRYMAKQKVQKADLQLIGTVATLIASKYEEIYPPDFKEFIEVSEKKWTKTEILRTEGKILTALDFDLFSPSPYRFLERFRKLCNSAGDERVFFLAQYLLEISLLDV